MKKRSDFAYLAPGTRFGRLEVVGEARKPNGGRGYLCKCDCGGSTVQLPHYLLRGRAISCKCARTMRVSLINRTHGQSRVKAVTTEYRSWSSMRNRCRDPNDKNYFRYGGRGIEVCDRWANSFENFFSDMGPKPTKLHSIERKNNDGNYSPENCLWADKKTQARNRRSTRLVKFRGREVSLAEAAELAGLPYWDALNRINRGESIDGEI